jgi:hypothetical protein
MGLFTPCRSRFRRSGQLPGQPAELRVMFLGDLDHYLEEKFIKYVTFEIISGI